MAVLCAVSARREPSLRGRLAWSAIALLACLVLLEEVDYGMHWYRAWNDIPYDGANNVNLHNTGRWTKRIMILVDTVTVAAFAIAPFLVRYLPPRLRPFVPSAYSVFTLLVIVATGNLARALERNGWHHSGSLTGNFSEFREVFTYWLAFLYLREVSLRRKTVTAPAA